MSRLTYTADMAEERTDTHPGPIQPRLQSMGRLRVFFRQSRCAALVVLGALPLPRAGIDAESWAVNRLGHQAIFIGFPAGAIIYIGMCMGWW